MADAIRRTLQFMDLPLELRVEIYRLLFRSNKSVDLLTLTREHQWGLSVLAVCSEMREEGLRIFWGENSVALDMFFSPNLASSDLPVDARDKISRCQFANDFYKPRKHENIAINIPLDLSTTKDYEVEMRWASEAVHYAPYAYEYGLNHMSASWFRPDLMRNVYIDMHLGNEASENPLCALKFAFKALSLLTDKHMINLKAITLSIPGISTRTRRTPQFLITHFPKLARWRKCLIESAGPQTSKWPIRTSELHLEIADEEVFDAVQKAVRVYR